MNEFSLSPGQILSLENKNDRLYGEVIQVIARRQLYWFRPLFLVRECSQAESLTDCNLIDLRQSSDLVLPQNWFKTCLDTEIVPLLAKLYSCNCLSTENISRRYLYDFVNSIWQLERNKKLLDKFG